MPAGGPRSHVVLNLAASPLYLRTDLSFGVRAGGSVAHIAGVVNELDRLHRSGDRADHRRHPDAERRASNVHHVAPDEAFWNFRELPTLLLNDAFDARPQQRQRIGRPARRSSISDTA